MASSNIFEEEKTDVCDGSFTEYMQKTLSGRTFCKCFTDAVFDTIRGLVVENCLGCQNSWPSQRDHHCLGGDGLDIVLLYVDDALEEPTLFNLFVEYCVNSAQKLGILPENVDKARLMNVFERFLKWYKLCETGRQLVIDLLHGYQ